MPKEVIARVEQLAEKDGFTRHAEPTIRTYALIPGVNNDDSDSESEYSYDSQDDISYQESISDQEVFEMTNRDYFPAGVNHETASDLNQQPPVQELPLPEGDDQNTQSQNQLDSGVENSDNSQQSDEDGDSELEQQQQAVEDPIPDDDPIPQGPRRSTRDRQARSVFVPTGQTHYEINNLATQGKPTTTLEYSTEEKKVLAMIFAQVYSLNAGLKKFGAKGKAAAYLEMKQLHDRTCTH